MNLVKSGYGEASGGLKLVFLIAATVIVITGLKAAAALFIPVLLAFFIATVSFPITSWLRKHRVPRWLAVLLTVLVDFAFLAGVVVVAVILVGELSDKWIGTGTGDPSYKTLLEQKIGDLSLFIVDQLDKRGFDNAQQTVDNYFRTKALDQLEQIDFRQVWSLGTGVVGRVASFFGTVFFVMLMTIFMLTEARICLLYTSPSPRDQRGSRMPSSA